MTYNRLFRQLCLKIIFESYNVYIGVDDVKNKWSVLIFRNKISLECNLNGHFELVLLCLSNRLLFSDMEEKSCTKSILIACISKFHLPPLISNWMLRSKSDSKLLIQFSHVNCVNNGNPEVNRGFIIVIIIFSHLVLFITSALILKLASEKKIFTQNWKLKPQIKPKAAQLWSWIRMYLCRLAIED